MSNEYITTVKYVLKNLFRSELDNKVLEYVK